MCLGLTLGLFTGIASLGGIFLLVKHAPASAGQNFNQQGLHVVMLACMVAFSPRAGRVRGVDGWLRRHALDAFGRLPLT